MPQNVIHVCWHNRMLVLAYLYRGRDIQVMVSASRDGELISRTIGRMGFGSIRGSTTRKGERALRGAARRLRAGSSVAITPDGPQGPRYRVQAGVVELARITQKPIIPVTVGVLRKKVLGSWDRLIVPLPFSRMVLIYGPKVRVEGDAGAEGVEEKRKELEDILKRITRQADEYFGKG